MSVLAQAAREVETALKTGRVTPATRTTFRPSRSCCATSAPGSAATRSSSEAHRGEQLKRLDGIATTLAMNAVRDSALLALLDEDAVVSDEARARKRELLRAAGLEPEADEPPPVEAGAGRRQAAGRAAVGRLAAAGQPLPRPRLLGAPAERAPLDADWPSWELLGPLLRSFERAGAGAPACMDLPTPSSRRTRGGKELMPHQARLVAAAAAATAPSCSPTSPGWARPPGPAGRRGGRRLPAARRRAERRQDQLGAGGRAVDAPPLGHRDPRQRRVARRLRRHRRRQLRGARPPRRVARRLRLPRDGRRRGALHQEQDLQRSQHVLEISERIRSRTGRRCSWPSPAPR
jgi:hypothetical protein